MNNDLFGNITASFKDRCEEYLSFYDVVKGLEAELESAKQLMEDSKRELIDLFDSFGVQSIKMDDGTTLVRQSMTLPKVEDFNKLRRYIEEELNEPLSDYTRIEFVSSKLKEMVKYFQAMAMTLKKPLEEVLPDGLTMSVTDKMVVRNHKIDVESSSLQINRELASMEETYKEEL